MKEGQKLYGILHNKCPRCHKGKFWPSGPYSNLFGNGGKLYECCSYCGLKYFREVGFYYGAMFVSYAIGAFTFLAFWLTSELIIDDDFSTWHQVFIIAGAMLLLAPVNYFLSRLIWINFFVGYDPFIANEPSIDAKPKMVNQT